MEEGRATDRSEQWTEGASKFTVAWAGPCAGLGVTLGFRSVSLALMAATRPGTTLFSLHLVPRGIPLPLLLLLLSPPLRSPYPSSPFVPPLRLLLRSPSVLRPFLAALLLSSLLLCPPPSSSCSPPSASLFLGGSFIYLFFWAGGRSLSLGAPAGWLLARLDVERSLPRILALMQGILTYHDCEQSVPGG